MPVAAPVTSATLRRVVMPLPRERDETTGGPAAEYPPLVVAAPGGTGQPPPQALAARPHLWEVGREGGARTDRGNVHGLCEAGLVPGRRSRPRRLPASE